jgi:hypothetical protein
MACRSSPSFEKFQVRPFFLPFAFVPTRFVHVRPFFQCSLVPTRTAKFSSLPQITAIGCYAKKFKQFFSSSRFLKNFKQKFKKNWVRFLKNSSRFSLLHLLVAINYSIWDLFHTHYFFWHSRCICTNLLHLTLRLSHPTMKLRHPLLPPCVSSVVVVLSAWDARASGFSQRSAATKRSIKSQEVSRNLQTDDNWYWHFRAKLVDTSWVQLAARVFADGQLNTRKIS